MKISVGDLARDLGLEAIGDLSLEITGAAEPADAKKGELALALNSKFAENLSDGKAEAAVLWTGADWRGLGLKAAIFAPRARLALAGVTRTFDRRPQVAPGIHPTALVSDTAQIGEGAAIGPYVVIGDRVNIGPGARIESHCVISDDTTIGANALVHAGARIMARVTVGDNFICQSGATIGSDGFAFVTPDPGAVEEARASGTVTQGAHEGGLVRIYSIGAVVIGDDVEVGANSCIDRGTVANTEIGSGTKIDNMVHVGHNVKVGENCMLCGQVGIAGSSEIGDRCVLGGQVGVADHVTIGSDVVAAGKSAISSHVPPGRVMMGNPAMRMDLNVEAYKALRRLPRTVAKLARIEKAVFKDEESQ